jgi:hypothetical protein
MYARSSSAKFRNIEDFPVYGRRFMNHLRALDPNYPRMLEGPPPPSAHVNLHYHYFHHRVLTFLNMAMEADPSSAIALTNFEQDPSFATQLSPSSNVGRALNYLLDHRGINMTVRLLLKLLNPQLINERLNTYLKRILCAFDELNNELVTPHP